eukprot:1456293-Prymnesium_polylepis.1
MPSSARTGKPQTPWPTREPHGTMTRVLRMRPEMRAARTRVEMRALTTAWTVAWRHRELSRRCKD